MSNEFTFVITSPIEVSEALTPSKMILSGIFIRLNIPTNNGRIYQVEEAEQIANDLKGMPVYYGANDKGLHLMDSAHTIGRIVDTVVDKVKEIIRGKVEVWNNELFPTLLQSITPGWGFSIGGKIRDFKLTGKWTETLKPILHALGMKANHIALLPPTVRRGDNAAQVDNMIPVMESLQMDPCPWGVCEAAQITESDSLQKAIDEQLNKNKENKVTEDRLRIIIREEFEKLTPKPVVKVDPPIKKVNKKYVIHNLEEGESAVVKKN